MYLLKEIIALCGTRYVIIDIQAPSFTRVNSLRLQSQCLAITAFCKAPQKNRFHLFFWRPMGGLLKKPLETFNMNSLLKLYNEMLWRGVPIEGDPYLETIGIDDYFKVLQRDIHKVQNRVRLSHFKGKTTCPTCKGGRLGADALCVRIDGNSVVKVNTHRRVHTDNLLADALINSIPYA